MKDKIKVGIIGTGNIGTDLLMKVSKSNFLECGLFVGRSENSKGIALASQMGIQVSTNSIDAIIDNPDSCDIVFDATSASVHTINAPILKKMNKYVIDLTPSCIGRMCIPALNLEECLLEQEVNMVTCGGQATVPIAYAISKVHPETSYIEIVATIASKSAGQGTRDNIDEFTQTTKKALAHFTGIPNTKAIIVLNPAEPPIVMHNTIYALIDNPNINEIRREVSEVEKIICEYVPGYKILVSPMHDNDRLVITLQVVGKGDYLPIYAGNLDIITCSAIRIAEEYAKRQL